MGFKHLPVVARCRERRNLLKEAAGYRYDLATAHLEYFVGLKVVGESLKKFVCEDLVYVTEEAGEEADSESLNLTSDSEDDDNEHICDDYESEDTRHSAPSINMNQAPHYRGQWMPGHQSRPHSSYYRHAHYMKRTAPAMKTVIHGAPTTGYLYKGGFGTQQQAQSWEEGSTWDFFSDSYRPLDGYHVPDLAEVRKREGIPDLEQVSENEEDQLLDKRNKGKRSSMHTSHSHEKTNGASFKHRSDHSQEKTNFEQEHERSFQARGTDQGERFYKHCDDNPESVHFNDKFSRTNVNNRCYQFNNDSELPTRDLREVVAEICDEFTAASEYGIEVALMLEVGKLPHQQSVFHEIFSRIMLKPTKRFMAAKASSLAKAYLGDVWREIERKPYNLSSTMDSLYLWEKKLYKEVKAEERLRLAYEKQFKLVQCLVENGAESTLIHEARASLGKLVTRLNVCVKPIITISTEIHRLRDEKLLPQIAELINGFITMWNLVLPCHQKQLRAIMDSEMETLKANTTTTSVKPSSRELDMELRAWSSRFNDWISTQKSFVLSLNAYLMLCLEYDPGEITSDRPAYYSPGRLQAPAVFLICNDWSKAMENVSNTGVADAIHSFASSLHELSKRQDEEQRQRVKARDFIPKRVRKRLVRHELKRGKPWHELDTMSDDALLSLFLPEKRNELMVNFDSLCKRLAEEGAKHKDAVERMQDAASSARGGLVPLFKALESFYSIAVKVHDQIRLIPR